MKQPYSNSAYFCAHNNFFLLQADHINQISVTKSREKWKVNSRAVRKCESSRSIAQRNTAASLTVATDWLASWLSTGSCAWSAAVLREQHTHTHTQRLPCLLKPSPTQSRLAQHSLRASAVRQAVEGACWGTDCHPPFSPWEAHCGCWSSQDPRNSLLPVCAVVYLKWSTVLPLHTTSRSVLQEMTP